MENKYLESKAVKKKRALTGVWLVILGILLFAFIIIKFAINNGMNIGSRGLPSEKDAYGVAKEFLKDDSRGENVSFPDDGFSFGKHGDSVYVVRATYEQSLDDGNKKSENFTVTMKYRGGPADDKSAWDLLNIVK
ncbi:hypothetical protein [Mucilaginibacter sp. KACC 22063]|uniref:hypothetical protein n=1 Tax=Mucilaginibacter sp. KACC 22063 TaxID=3025666 RepID=UPI0023671DDC|nr:hypothetical protein [Mucilaginibacter sp. KACC 22063]WDF53639.1 hypothetical protein PQ461_11855 [Mucilaginibacter sp. KACC 22063]